MRRFWISLVVLALAAGTAVGQPARKSPATLAAETDAAQARLGKAQAERRTLGATKAAVAKRYESELAAVDRLKQQRKSWRRESQLQDAQARALDTSTELATLTTKIAKLDARIAADKRGVLQAIDAELPVATDAARRRLLTASRAASAPPAPVKARKITVPDAEIDPLADPEELDQQAQALRASEAELAKQIDTLDVQSRRLLKADELRKAHERAGDLAIRDDEQPRRTGTTGGGRTLGANEDSGDLGPNDLDPSPPPGESPMGDGAFQGDETAIVLSELIDPATGDALRRATGTDPGTKARAAKLARDQVAARLEALKKKRAAIEARAKSLRKK
jgi:hypothetical protein